LSQLSNYVIFSVHSVFFLIFCVYFLRVNGNQYFPANISETITDELMQRWYGPDMIVAEIKRKSGPLVQMKMSDIPITEKLEKFVEDVK
jgi:nuclear receptor-binding protein